MMFKNSSSSGELNGFLDAGSHLSGDLSFEDTFRVDGKLTGSVTSKGDLIIGESGQIEGEVKVHRVFISGQVRGSIEAAERIEIAAKGRVRADLSTPSLTVEDGAFFEGRCSMGKTGSEAKDEKVTKMPLNAADRG